MGIAPERSRVLVAGLDEQYPPPETLTGGPFSGSLLLFAKQRQEGNSHPIPELEDYPANHTAVEELQMMRSRPANLA